MFDLDLRLLSVFDEIYKTRSVSRAADVLNLGQPAVSIALSRLREHFNDPLFVRTANCMEPTSLGQELIHPMREALTALGRALGHRSVFDPKTARRTFCICMNDISQLVLLISPWDFFRNSTRAFTSKRCSASITFAWSRQTTPAYPSR
jgi:DNA-binding transcriptional LysR family regulator